MTTIFKSVSFTKFYNDESLDAGFMGIYVNDELVYSGSISYKQAVKEAYELARKLDKDIELYNNPLNPMIAYGNIYGSWEGE